MYPSIEIPVILLFASLFAQISATKRIRENSLDITTTKAKEPLPFDLNQPAPDDNDGPNKKRLKSSPAKKKSSEFYRAKYRRLKERMQKDPELVQRVQDSKMKYELKKKTKMTEAEKEAHKESVSARNHQQYLRRKAIYGKEVIKQRREVAQIKEQMKFGQVSVEDKKKVDDYYAKKRKRDRDYEPRRKQRRKDMFEVDDNYWPAELSPAHAFQSTSS
ncbi:uncharacterized protein FA14DRAFT_180372 [Meira miltonrushii]|uniref:Uncharacterized protein n=1 Tax=Meira miltonrushii TaxID=1280837 RepID=A0A316V8B1_9BASI|nr:uncharacterized protein FA14DRAFT_180372 [Meira miltonrushii]PWN33736.1 hypothetical protein FA14DRAFT_180372 [Meira miltonrushii]